MVIFQVSESAATLLNMLKISPFTYGLDILHIYDSGSVFSPAILDITDDDIRTRFLSGVQNIAAVSLAIGYPTGKIFHVFIIFRTLSTIDLILICSFLDLKNFSGFGASLYRKRIPQRHGHCRSHRNRVRASCQHEG